MWLEKCNRAVALVDFADENIAVADRGPRGIRLIDHVPHGHWKTITFVAGLRRRGMIAPFVLDGPMNATAFIAYLERFLVPTLKRGDTVMMDSLPVHKVAGLREFENHVLPAVKKTPVMAGVCGTDPTRSCRRRRRGWRHVR